MAGAGACGSRVSLACALALAGCTGGHVSSTEAPGRDAGPGTSASDAGPGTDASAPPDCGARTACGSQCADLATDPTSCGSCGRTCRVPNGTAGCADGQCTVASCDPGHHDADGDVDNGCEAEGSACTPGESCETACGSTGTTRCSGGTASCEAPAEACNMTDDDCNGRCDEGGLDGCRIGVHRSSGNGHLYTTDGAAARAAPYTLEVERYFWLYQDSHPGLRPVFLCRKADGKRFLTSSTACEEAGVREARLGFWATSESCGAVPLYRLYHPPTNNHFYTLSAAERDRAASELGYRKEGVAGWVWTSR